MDILKNLCLGCSRAGQGCPKVHGTHPPHIGEVLLQLQDLLGFLLHMLSPQEGEQSLHEHSVCSQDLFRGKGCSVPPLNCPVAPQSSALLAVGCPLSANHAACWSLSCCPQGIVVQIGRAHV